MIVNFTHPNQLQGYHIATVMSWKPGVYRVMTTKKMGAYHHADWSYCRADVLRVAIETGVVKKPNGRTMA